MALFSLVMGIISIVLVSYKNPWCLVALIMAIVGGRMAMARIHASLQDVKGRVTARIGMALGCMTLFAAFLIPGGSRIQERGLQAKAINNCRQIITTLRLSISESGGYPDEGHSEMKTSNDVFHRLFIGGEANDEMMFGAPLSPFRPDGKIGDPPDYKEALRPGENHWAMTKGLSEHDTGAYPLIYENPVEASWPPKWNADLQDVPQPGRVWKSAKVIIGMNDSSVALQKLESDKGDRVGLKRGEDGKDLFTRNEKTFSVLNVAR